MKKWAYYNEHDPSAAQWIRSLIKAGLITDGEVDERSIEDVLPSDVQGFVRVHWFAGIAGWEYALRLAGWPDNRPVWTGSCPCQPFSAAGKGAGFADERHLWPAWFHLIEQCRPGVVFGEQVEAAIKHDWLDLVQDDLEGIGYAVGAVGLPAASVGAPHIRQRLWFVANCDGSRRGTWRPSEAGDGGDASRVELAGLRAVGEFGNTKHPRLEGFSRYVNNSQEPGRYRTATGGPVAETSANGFWSDSDWLPCRDGKVRPVESAIERMADGISDSLGLVRIESYPDRPHEERLIYSPLIQKGKSRVMRLRGYGNAIVPQVAAEIIKIYSDGI